MAGTATKDVVLFGPEDVPGVEEPLPQLISSSKLTPEDKLHSYSPSDRAQRNSPPALSPPALLHRASRFRLVVQHLAGDGSDVCQVRQGQETRLLQGTG